jgi:HEAT repeat protein
MKQDIARRKDQVNEDAMSASVSLADTIHSMLADLSSSRALTRRRARESLVAVGRSAVTSLITALADPNEHVRWEAIRALEEIGGPEVPYVLVNALENDEDGGIRWLAAEGLIGLRHEGLVPLLQALVRHSDSARLREEARYVIRSLAKKNPDLNSQLNAVLAALEDAEPAQVPSVAQATLDALTGS